MVYCLSSFIKITVGNSYLFERNMDSNFSDAVTHCLKDCFGVQNACPNQFNDMKKTYDLRQEEIKKSMETLSNRERDAVMRNLILTELRRHEISDTSDRIPLEFEERFGNTTKKICENCFCYLYKRKSKRTYEFWKSLLKKSIVKDKDAAHFQSLLHHLVPRRQKNW